MLVVLYEEMRRIAGAQMRNQSPHHTLQATALVNEAYLRLRTRKSGAPDYADPDRLLSMAASAMRSVLVDNARAKSRVKRSPQGSNVPLEEVDDVRAGYEQHAIDLLALDEALERLVQRDEQMVRIVELRFFGGLDTRDIARILGLTTRRVDAEWRAARAWLRKELQ